MRERFWELFSLGELNSREWEALCDGCGLCCLIRFADNKKVYVYDVACDLLDCSQARCRDYPNRLEEIPSCHELTPERVAEYDWLPKTCAYRLLHLKKPLPKWHPLLTGNCDLMRKKKLMVHPTTPHESDVPLRKMKGHYRESWRRKKR